MALIECRECKNVISSEAQTCPKCGVSDPDLALERSKERSNRQVLVLLGIVVAIVLVIIIIFSVDNYYSFTPRDSEDSTVSHTPRDSEDSRRVKNGFEKRKEYTKNLQVFYDNLFGGRLIKIDMEGTMLFIKGNFIDNDFIKEFAGTTRSGAFIQAKGPSEVGFKKIKVISTRNNKEWTFKVKP